MYDAVAVRMFDREQINRRREFDARREVPAQTDWCNEAWAADRRVGIGNAGV